MWLEMVNTGTSVEETHRNEIHVEIFTTIGIGQVECVVDVAGTGTR